MKMQSSLQRINCQRILLNKQNFRRADQYQLSNKIYTFTGIVSQRIHKGINKSSLVFIHVQIYNQILTENYRKQRIYICIYNEHIRIWTESRIVHTTFVTELKDPYKFVVFLLSVKRKQQSSRSRNE